MRLTPLSNRLYGLWWQIPWVAVVAFVVGLALSVAVALWKQGEVEKTMELEFQHKANSVIEHVRSSLNRCLYGLNGARGLYVASKRVGRSEFREYVESLDLEREFPGVRGLSFVQRVHSSELAGFVSAERADGVPQFAVRQLEDDTHDDHYIVRFMEPMQQNLRALGLDLGSEPKRRVAIERAIDTGLPTLTEAITLVQDQQRTPGMLLFVPVFANGRQPATADERRSLLRGVLSAPLVMTDVFAGLSDVHDGWIAYDLFDGVSAGGNSTDGAMLFHADGPGAALPTQDGSDSADKHKGRFTSVQTIPMFGRNLVLRVQSTSAFDATIDHTASALVIAIGAVLSALLAWLVGVQYMRQRRAMQNMLGDVDELVMQKHALDQHAIVAATDVQGKITYANDKFCEISGYSRDELIGQDHKLLNSGHHPHGFFKAMYRTVAAGQTWRDEVCNRAKDGHLYWVDTTIVPVMDAQGKPARYLAIRADITQRKQAEIDLAQQKSELELQKYALDQFAIVAITDVRGRITYVNDKFCDISGYSREELMGQDHKLLNSGQHPHGFFRTMYRTVANGNTWRAEVCNRAKDGHLYWVDTTIVPILNRAGKPERYLTVRADITARKQAEMELAQQKSELELQKYALDQHAIVATTDVQGKITYANDKFCDISGYSREELMGRDHSLLNSGHHPHGFFKAMYRMVATGRTWHAEVCNRAKDGHLYWVDTTIVPVMNSVGRVERYLAIRADITLRKQVEFDLVQSQLELEARVQQKTEAAVRSEQHLRLVIDNSLDAIVGMDSHGCITEWSKQAERIFGWSLAEVLHQPLHEFIIPERFRQAHQQGLARYLSKGQAAILGKRMESFALRRDGTEFPVEMVVSPIVSSEEVTFSAFITDVTQRKAEQAALLAAKAQAESASRAKSEFLANMSHEIRTPMNGIIGMVDILQEGALAPEQRRMLRTVQKSSMALLQILNDILDFSKIEAGKLEIEDVPMDLRSVAEEVSLLLATQLGAQGELALLVAPELPAWVLGDPSRMRQVLLNLMGNAIKFSSKSGQERSLVSLHVQPCVLPGGQDGVRLDVVDNGIGMPPEVVSKLFQPFTQADESTARRFGGTGLGLSISGRLVGLMGGQISVQSAVGKGSTFSVTLPLRPTHHDKPRPELPSLAGLNVLLVSSEPFDVHLHTSYCQHAGARVHVVPDARAARDFLLALPSRQDWVVIVDRKTVEPIESLGLPTDIGVLREAPRGKELLTGELVVAVSPMLLGDLIRSIALASGRWKPVNAADARKTAAHAETVRDKAVHTVEHAIKQHRLILLAEDNETNREVMQEQLRLLGHACEVAHDGAEALRMWKADPGRYALLLSDCHMPNLDGFGLTAAIRQSEAPGEHMPIIAVTANAMQGEAQRCMEQGMDGYLAKPLRMQALQALLQQWLPNAIQASISMDDEPVNGGDAPALERSLVVWDPATLTKLVGNRPEMHQRLLDRFLVSAKDKVVELQLAAAQNDPKAMGELAHALKSAARSIGAMQMGQWCQGVETAGRAGDVSECQRLAAQVASEFAAVQSAIGRR